MSDRPTRWFVEKDAGIYVYEAEEDRWAGQPVHFRGPDFATEMEAVQFALDCALDHRERAQMDINTHRRRLRTLKRRKPTGSRGALTQTKDTTDEA